MSEPKVVLSFFEYTGTMLKPWAEAGYQCYAFDFQHGGPVRDSYGRPDEGFIEFRHWDAMSGLEETLAMIDGLLKGRKVAFVFGFPPCTDLAASGARHWKAKAALDPNFQRKAIWMARLVEAIARVYAVPFMIENPVGALCTQWRKPNYRFSPHEYGGYLGFDEGPHPRWPEYIPAFDAYTKSTCLWTGNGFEMPEPLPVEPEVLTTGTGKTGSRQWAKLGGKSMKTKNIRSATPRGFAKAVFIAQHTE